MRLRHVLRAQADDDLRSARSSGRRIRSSPHESPHQYAGQQSFYTAGRPGDDREGPSNSACPQPSLRRSSLAVERAVFQPWSRARFHVDRYSNTRADLAASTLDGSRVARCRGCRRDAAVPQLCVQCGDEPSVVRPFVPTVVEVNSNSVFACWETRRSIDETRGARWMVIKKSMSRGVTRLD